MHEILMSDCTRCKKFEYCPRIIKYMKYINNCTDLQDEDFTMDAKCKHFTIVYGYKPLGAIKH